jgi:hypothetical protein
MTEPQVSTHVVITRSIYTGYQITNVVSESKPLHKTVNLRTGHNVHDGERS